MTTVFYCLKTDCQYNDGQGVCEADEIELDVFGKCLAQEDD